MPYLTPRERVGTLLADRYRVEHLLGQGGMGAVFRATHTWTDRPVALKVLLPHLLDDETVVARFLQEAKAAARLRHPSVVDVLDMGRSDDGTVFLVMELLDGHPLSELLDGEPLDPELALGILVPLLGALRAAHALGIVHRDLKPDNIFIARTGDDEWVPKLLDFGIARLAQDSDVMTRSGAVLGTPQYMSPEQAVGEVAGPTTDVWAMGIVAYECLQGRSPFHGQSHMGLVYKLATEAIPGLATVAPGIHPLLASAVDRALARLLADRYAHGGEFADALSRAAAAAGLTPSLARLDALVRSMAGAPSPDLVPTTAQPDALSAAEAPSQSGEVARAESPRGAAQATRLSEQASAAPAPDQASSPDVSEATSDLGHEAAHTGSRARPDSCPMLVVRPYGPRIRSRVFPLFEAAGLHIGPDAVIAAKTGDDEAIARVLGSTARTLLVPFHGHRDERGARVDGLEFLRKLEERSPGGFRWRVVMPVSAFARASVTLRVEGGDVSARVRHSTLFLYDDELDEPGQAERIAAHVAGSFTDEQRGGQKIL